MRGLRCRGQGLAGRALLGLVVLVFAALAALPAWAETTLVTNTGGAVASDTEVVSATSFTTGPTPGGYVLTGVQLDAVTLVDSIATATFVEIRANNSANQPGNLVAALSNLVSRSTDLDTFTGPDNITLAANTIYWVVVNPELTSLPPAHLEISKRLGFGRVSETGQTGQAGWLIGNIGLSKSLAGDSFWSSTANPLKMTIRGRHALTGHNYAATGRPRVSGLEKRGAKVTASPSGISDIDGLTRADNGEAGYAYGYQWIRVDGEDETDIDGETSRSYTLAEADVGKRVRVRVSFQDDNGVAEARTSSPFPGRGSITNSGPQLSRSVANRFQFWKRDSALGLLTEGPINPLNVPLVSQRFTTGSNVTAYRLEAVQIAIDLIDPSTRMTVYLHEDNDGLPGSRTLRLDPLGSLRDGTMQFRPRQLQGEYPLLAPDTYYHIRFDRDRGGAYLDVAVSNDVAMNGGFGLDDHSLSYILPSSYNEAIVFDDCSTPAGYEGVRGEYGDDYVYLEEAPEEFLVGITAEIWSTVLNCPGPFPPGFELVTVPGFDVTYGWNRMSRQLRMRLIGTAITSGSPVFNLPPKPVSAAVVPTGNLLDIVLDNVPDDGAGRIPLPEHFTVKADGGEVAVSAVEVSGADKRVRLRLARMVKDDERVTVSYRDPGTGDNTAALQSPAGVDAPGFANYRVTNGSMIPSLRPAPVSATVPAAGNRVDIVFSHAPDDSAGRTPAPERFSVTADGMDITVSAVEVSASDQRVRLTVSPAIKTLQAVAVSYRDPSVEDDTAALQSPAGSDARSFTDFPAANASMVPDPAPKPVSATVPPAGDLVDIVFNHALDDGTGRMPARSRFTVTADRQRVPIDAIDISRSDMRVRLMLMAAQKRR